MFMIQVKETSTMMWRQLCMNGNEGAAIQAADRVKDQYAYVRVVDSNGHMVYQSN
jgi:hypothetical protein